MSEMICIECVIEKKHIPDPKKEHPERAMLAIAVWKGCTLCYRHLSEAFRKVLES